MTKFTIHKFTLAGAKEQQVNMPRSARVLDVQLQPQADGVALCVWALVLAGDAPQPRHLVFVETGEILDGDFIERFEHVSTVQSIHVAGEGATPKSIVTHVFLERPAVN